MESNKKLNDLIINLKPKVIRFTGEKFPNELWNSGCQIKKNKKREKILDYVKQNYLISKLDFKLTISACCLKIFAESEWKVPSHIVFIG